MKKDYHLHPRILDPSNAFENFIHVALDNGIKEICITDHMPLSVSNAGDRIPNGQIKAYCRRVRELAKRCEDMISIKCGIEIDYHPSVLDEIQRARPILSMILHRWQLKTVCAQQRADGFMPFPILICIGLYLKILIASP